MRLLATILLLALAGPLFAQELSYNYIEGSYFRTDLDGNDVNIDGDGYGLYGSTEVGSMWHIFANFTSSDLDGGADYDQIWIGGGLHRTLAPGLSLFFNLAYVNVDANGEASPFDDDGLGTALGLRMFVFPKVEVSGAISYSEVGDSSSTGIDAKGWYYLTNSFALGGGVGFTNDVTTYGVGARYYFK